MAGIDTLSPYSNYFEIETLASILNTNYNQVLKTDDGFCTKILIMNLKRINFGTRLAEIKTKK